MSKLNKIRQSINSVREFLTEASTSQSAFNPKSNTKWTYNLALSICNHSGNNKDFDQEIEAWAYMQSNGTANLLDKYTSNLVYNYFKNKLIEKNGHINWNKVDYYKKHGRA